MLPFDAQDQQEAARRIIYEPVPFNHPIWEFVTKEAKDLIASKFKPKNILKDCWRKIDLKGLHSMKSSCILGFVKEAKKCKRCGGNQGI